MLGKKERGRGEVSKRLVCLFGLVVENVECRMECPIPTRIHYMTVHYSTLQYLTLDIPPSPSPSHPHSMDSSLPS